MGDFLLIAAFGAVVVFLYEHVWRKGSWATKDRPEFPIDDVVSK